MKRLVWFLAITVAFVCHQADADTNLPIVCSSCTAGQPADPATAFSWKTPVATDLVLIASTDGDWSIGTWQAWGMVGTGAFVRACPQDVAHGFTGYCSGDFFMPRGTWPPIIVPLPPPPPQVVMALPSCWPALGKLHWEQAPANTGYGYGAVWSCESPRGVKNIAMSFNFDELLRVINPLGGYAKADADAEFTRSIQAATDEQQSYQRGLISQFGSRALVSANGAALTRPVYAATPAFVRITTAVPGARVSVAARCRVFDRLPGTPYYSVKGLPNVSTADPNDVLGEVYAVCTRTDPIGVNK